MQNNKVIYLTAILLTILSIIGCSPKKKSSNYDSRTYAPTYAKGFELFKYGSSSVIRIKNPWQGADDVQMDLFISKDGELPPKDFEGTVINSPLNRVICLSGSYTAYINEINSLDKIIGVSGIDYITNKEIHQRHKDGKVSDVGYDNNFNYELISKLNPQLVLIYGVSSANTMMTDKLKEMNINALYIGEYLEQHPLGKAEWVVLFGELFGCRDLAINKFDKIVNNYNTTKEIVNNYVDKGVDNPVNNYVDSKPTVMLNAPYRDVWFVPGDNNYIVQLINDAGGEYICKGTKNEISRPISAESAYIFASRADFWLNPNQISSIRELVATNPKFTDIKSVKNGAVYNNIKNSTPMGGSDFWERGATTPHLILHDLANIFYPGVLESDELHYFIKLQ